MKRSNRFNQWCSDRRVWLVAIYNEDSGSWSEKLCSKSAGFNFYFLLRSPLLCTAIFVWAANSAPKLNFYALSRLGMLRSEWLVSSSTGSSLKKQRVRTFSHEMRWSTERERFGVWRMRKWKKAKKTAFALQETWRRSDLVFEDNEEERVSNLRWKDQISINLWPAVATCSEC